MTRIFIFRPREMKEMDRLKRLLKTNTTKIACQLRKGNIPTSRTVLEEYILLTSPPIVELQLLSIIRNPKCLILSIEVQTTRR
jgi:hypothetical protein